MVDADHLLATKILAERPPAQRGGGSVVSGLPPSLIQQAARRLQLVSLVLIVLVVLDWLVGNFVEGELLHELTTPVEWVPNVALLVASTGMLGFARLSGRSRSTVITAGLLYQVVVSWCIPLSVYWGVFGVFRGDQLSADVVGSSPVALWMLFFTVIVPARPKHSLLALSLSAASTPVTVAILIRMGNAPTLPAQEFVFIFVAPYVFALVAAYIGARVIYGLGRDVQRAMELGSYHLLELIGRGGMGEVWKARHNFLARPAAIKLIHPDALSPERRDLEAVLSRFEREAQVTAALQSPHTVALYDFGVSESGALYYAMELLDGMDLESLVRRFGPLPPERVVRIVQQVCQSLDEAHRQGLVHRDIKPANIFLCCCAFERDFVKVLDFGLVKRTASTGETETALVTQANIVAGTPAYLAPEMAAGKEAVDGRADIYSLGCVAFWLLTGRPVFEAPSAMAVIVAHCQATPPAPSEVAEQDVPPELDALVLACLAKNPDERPATASQLSQRLEETGLDGRWSQERAAEWWRAHDGRSA